MRLEDELEVKLFDRTSKGATPTKAGLIFRQKAEEILKIERETKQHLDNLKKVSVDMLMDDNIIMLNDKFKVNHIFKTICEK